MLFKLIIILLITQSHGELAATTYRFGITAKKAIYTLPRLRSQLKKCSENRNRALIIGEVRKGRKQKKNTFFFLFLITIEDGEISITK